MNSLKYIEWRKHMVQKDCHGANRLDAFVFHKLNKKERVGVFLVNLEFVGPWGFCNKCSDLQPKVFHKWECRLDMQTFYGISKRVKGVVRKRVQIVSNAFFLEGAKGKDLTKSCCLIDPSRGPGLIPTPNPHGMVTGGSKPLKAQAQYLLLLGFITSAVLLQHA